MPKRKNELESEEAPPSKLSNSDGREVVHDWAIPCLELMEEILLRLPFKQFVRVAPQLCKALYNSRRITGRMKLCDNRKIFDQTIFSDRDVRNLLLMVSDKRPDLWDMMKEIPTSYEIPWYLKKNGEGTVFITIDLVNTLEFTQDSWISSKIRSENGIELKRSEDGRIDLEKHPSFSRTVYPGSSSLNVNGRLPRAMTHCWMNREWYPYRSYYRYKNETIYIKVDIGEIELLTAVPLSELYGEE